jgi:hypothetical protein
MRIDAIAASIGSRPFVNRATSQRDAAEATQHGHKRDEIGVDSGEVGSATQSSDADSRGVLRLLENGHFKGVAELRHLIKYADQIRAQRQSDAATAVPQQVSGLMDSVNQQVDALLAPLSLRPDAQQSISTLRSDFDQALQTAVSDHASNGQVDLDGLTAALQSAFDGFVAQLQQIVDPAPAPATTIDPVAGTPAGDLTVQADVATETQAASSVAADPAGGVTPSVTSGVDPAVDPAISGNTAATVDPATGDVPQPSLADAFAALVQSFNDALAQLNQAVNSSLQLPEPQAPAPDNHGAAYARFLAIYNDLRGVSGDSASAASQSLNAVA